MAICRYCNYENAEGKKFCGNCGASLNQPTSEATAPSEVPTFQQPQPLPQQVSQEGPNSKYVEPANTIPFNEKDQKAYQEKLAHPNRPDYENTSVLAFVLGFVSIIFNPLLLTSIAAIVLGIIGHANQGSKKKMAMIGWILGLITLVIRLVVYALIVYGIITIARGLLLWF